MRAFVDEGGISGGGPMGRGGADGGERPGRKVAQHADAVRRELVGVAGGFDVVHGGG